MSKLTGLVAMITGGSSVNMIHFKLLIKNFNHKKIQNERVWDAPQWNILSRMEPKWS